jgi:hypothetical protein
MITAVFYSCKSIDLKNRETTSNILFKKLLKNSEEINDLYVKGLFMVSGVKEIPAAYVSFVSRGNIRSKNIRFEISFLKKKVIDIVMENNRILLINHTGKQYIRMNYEEIDFSRYIGVNFNPMEISYLLLGQIPYSPDLEMMKFDWNKKEYRMEMTSRNSTYEIFLNRDEEIIRAAVRNQFFDTIYLDSIKYSKNDDGKNIPKSISFLTEGGKIRMSFIIEKISTRLPEDEINLPLELKDYTEVTRPEDIVVKIR